MLRRIIAAMRSALAKRAGLLRVTALAFAVVLLVAATPNPAEACSLGDIPSCVAMIFVKIFQLLTALMGWILVMEVEAVIRVSQYFNFVSPGPSAVQIGWVVTRDLANMFFIVILLIIAFGTILGSSTYHYDKNLKRLLIMAVVINFSKTICGIFIDMGQVVMLTFVNGFKEAAAGNFINAFQINKLLALGNSNTGTYDFGMVIAMMFAFILAAVAACVTLVLLVVLLFRVVMLWVLIILSPIAFLSSAIPSGGSYYADWWKEFRKYITTGPIIAFFMWLALASVQHVGTGGFASQGFPATYAGQGEAAAAAGEAQGRIPSQAGTADVIMNMVIAVCILFAGLKFASESGVAGAGFAKSVRGGLEKAGRGIAAYGIKRAAEPVLTTAGKGLARVPLVGGLGRNLALRGEAMKKERLAASEKRFGGAEDFARLSPGAYKRSLAMQMAKPFKDDIDKKRLDGMVRAGLSNPSIAKSIGDGTGAAALGTVIARSKGKGLQDAVGLMMSDKNVNAWAKDPDKPNFLADAYAKVKEEAATDPNMKKTLAEMEQKFAPQLIENGLMEATRLKDIAPKMTMEDVAGLGAGDMATFAPYLNAKQLQKLAQDGTNEQLNGKDGKGGLLAAIKGVADPAARKDLIAKLAPGDVPAAWYGEDEFADHVLDKSRNDPKARGEVTAKDKDGKLAKRADARLAAAVASGDAKQFLSALPDAISVGSLTAASIASDDKLQAAIKQNAGQIDLQGIGRNVSVGDAARTDAGKAVAALISDVNPEKVRNARKGGMNDHVLPSASEMEARAAGARAAQVGSLSDEAPKLIVELQKQLSAIQTTSAAAPSQAANEEIAKLTQAIGGLQQSMTQRAEALKSLEGMRGRISEANSGRVPMAAPELEALKTAADNFEKRLSQLDSAIAKTVADVKGIKFDAGKENRGGKKGNRQA